jgi:DNA-binding PadR family transcriptional regulator
MNDTETVLENLIQELKRGTLVLTVLLCTAEPVYGYALVGRLQERGIDVDQNTLYPLLRRLEKQGLLASDWDMGDARPRRYYRISDDGRIIRDRLLAEWKSMNAAIGGMEKTKENGR